MVKSKTNKQEKFYVTTAIDYPNAEPHIGHAYQKVIADVLARWHKLLGKDVLFVTGTDEHGKKIQETAEKLGKTPKEFVDQMSEKFKEAWFALDVNYDRFIRTTDKDHENIVKDAIEKCNKTGDIYKGTYEGLYCVGCEAYYTEKDLVDGKCPLHNRPIEKLTEESYFFKLSKYEKYILDLYKKNKNLILTKERKNEMANRVKEGLKDLSISRTSFNWGIPFPLDKKHIVYVWFDALFNYISASGKNQEYWPASVHLLGKDNAWFHSVYWPAFLKSAGYDLPKTVFIHGFLTFNGQKISKSLGNAISPITLAEKYTSDSIRYYITRNFVFGEDGDFSEEKLVDRHNNELANKLGNLVSRVSTLAEKYGLEETKPLDSKKTYEKVKKHMENYEFDKALNEIFAFIDVCNEYAQNKKPWETKDTKVIWQLANGIKDATILVSPFLPKTSDKIAKTFSFKLNLEGLAEPLKTSKVQKSEVLFNKIEYKPVEDKNIKIKNDKKIEGIINMADMIKYDDFAKIDLRVATIKKAEDIEGADKLYKLTVEVGNESRTVIAGIKKYYKKEELTGKQVIVIINLEPRKMKGLESQGMLLAAGGKDEDVCVLISPEKSVKSGTKIN